MFKYLVAMTVSFLTFTSADSYLKKITCPILLVTADKNYTYYKLEYVECVLLGEYDDEGSLDCTESFTKLGVDLNLNPPIRHYEPLKQCGDRK